MRDTTGQVCPSGMAFETRLFKLRAQRLMLASYRTVNRPAADSEAHAIPFHSPTDCREVASDPGHR